MSAVMTVPNFSTSGGKRQLLEPGMSSKVQSLLTYGSVPRSTHVSRVRAAVDLHGDFS